MLRADLIRISMPNFLVQYLYTLLGGLVRSASLVALLALSGLAHSQEPSPEPKRPLSLASAVALALSQNPALAVYNYDVRAVEARRIRAGYRPNPAIGLEVENLPGSGSRSGADATETTLQLSQVIELGGKRTRRLAEARLSGHLAAWDYETRRLDVLAETTRQFIEVVAAQERLALAGEALNLAKLELAAVAERVQAARTSVVEQKKAEISVARAAIEREHADHTLLSARKALAASWGSEAPVFTTARADFFATGRTESFGSLMARIGTNPDLARFATEARVREAQLALARTGAVQDVTVSAGIRQFADENEWAGVFGVSVPLPFFDRGQADIYEALQMQGKTDALGRAIRVALATRLFGIYQELLHSVTELKVMAKEILPAANEVLKETEEGYRLGRFSYLELSDARRSLIELRRQNIETALTYHTSRVEIDRVIGTSALAIDSVNPAPASRK